MNKEKLTAIILSIVAVLVVAAYFIFVNGKSAPATANNSTATSTASTTPDFLRYNQIDPKLAEAIIAGYETNKAVYESGDATVIRKHLLVAVPASAAAINKMSDKDILSLASFQTNADKLLGDSTKWFMDKDTYWIFNTDKTQVSITIHATKPDGNIEVLRLVGVYNNGQWYF